jgi:hypothetical protein
MPLEQFWNACLERPLSGERTHATVMELVRFEIEYAGAQIIEETPTSIRFRMGARRSGLHEDGGHSPLAGTGTGTLAIVAGPSGWSLRCTLDNAGSQVVQIVAIVPLACWTFGNGRIDLAELAITALILCAIAVLPHYLVRRRLAAILEQIA